MKLIFQINMIQISTDSISGLAKKYSYMTFRKGCVYAVYLYDRADHWATARFGEIHFKELI